MGILHFYSPYSGNLELSLDMALLGVYGSEVRQGTPNKENRNMSNKHQFNPETFKKNPDNYDPKEPTSPGLYDYIDRCDNHFPSIPENDGCGQWATNII